MVADSEKWSYNLVMKTVAASEFKARCLALLDDVARSGQPLVVTKHGRPFARVLPTSLSGTEQPQDTLVGTVTIVGDVLAPTSAPGDWHARRGLLVSRPRSRGPRRKHR